MRLHATHSDSRGRARHERVHERAAAALEGARVMRVMPSNTPQREAHAGEGALLKCALLALLEAMGAAGHKHVERRERAARGNLREREQSRARLGRPARVVHNEERRRALRDSGLAHLGDPVDHSDPSFLKRYRRAPAKDPGRSALPVDANAHAGSIMPQDAPFPYAAQKITLHTAVAL